jgi:DNA ligase (NAD+)
VPKPAPKKLVADLQRYKDAYYNGTPLISDAAYDALEDELRAIDPKHAFFATVGAPVAVTAWEKARHAIPMGSLNKAVGAAEFQAWASRCDALATQQKLPSISSNLFITEKLDGLSLAVTYDKGQLRDAITRGDGQVGERITSNAARMKGVPKKLPKPVSITVRGEIILTLSEMKKHFPSAANPRNQAAGTSKRFDGQGCEHLTVMFYDLDGENLATEADKLKRLKALSFLTPPFFTGDLGRAQTEHDRYAKKARAALNYEIDGLVIRANDTHVGTLLGDLGNRPRAAVAYKFASQAQATQVRDIVWETGASGRVSPVAVVAPVQLAGATVQRASLANASRVAELDIGIGDDVLVSRRNDVIPYVEEVVKKKGKTAKPPATCGVCKSKLSKEGEYLVCRNDSCRALIEGRIQNWVDAQGVGRSQTGRRTS